MQRMTDNAKAHRRRERWRRWVAKNIIAEDPRSQEEQMRDDLSRDRSGLCFLLLVAGVCGYVALAVYILL